MHLPKILFTSTGFSCVLFKNLDKFGVVSVDEDHDDDDETTMIVTVSMIMITQYYDIFSLWRNINLNFYVVK